MCLLQSFYAIYVLVYNLRMKIKKFFLLSWKKILLVIGIFIVSSILHNLVSALLNIEEAFFFIIAVLLSPLYILVGVLVTLVEWIRSFKNA